jgi:uncharacterized membrane protein
MISKLWEVSASATTIRTGIFTAGHFTIDVFVIAWITGAPIGTATLASIIGPALNGIWFWLIDRWWSQRHADSEQTTEIVESW